MVLRLSSKAAAVGVGALLVMTVPGVGNAAAPSVAQAGATVVAADPTYPPPIQQVSCKARTNAARTVFKLNMGPNLPGNQYYIFRMEKKTKQGWVRYLKQYKTKGSRELRTVNVPKGTWRARCYSIVFPLLASPRIDATSNSVKIRR